jgi:hypothetical protein
MTDQLAGSWQMMLGFGVLISEHPEGENLGAPRT